jgi:O-antigen ligase
MSGATAQRFRSSGLSRRWLREAALAAGAAILMGWLIATGSNIVLLAAGIIALASMALVISNHLYPVFVAWIAIEGLAFPFVRYPLNHNLITFDRVVLLAMGAALLLNKWPAMSKPVRRLTQAFALFTVLYGLRALTTTQLPLPVGYLPSASYQPILDWLDTALLPLIAFLVAVRTLTTVQRWMVMAKALTFLGVTIATLALMEWALGFDLASFSGYSSFVDQLAGVIRAGGPYPDPTAYGGVMLVCLAGTLYWAQAERAYLLGGAVAVYEVIGLAPSYTKTVWGAGLLVVAITIGLRRRFASRFVLVAFMLAVSVGVLYSVFQSSTVVQARVTSHNSADNFTGRVAAWEQGIAIFKHYPAFGAGVEQFIGAQQVVGPVYRDGVKAVPSPHNTLISVLGEGGLTSFVPLVLTMIATYLVLRMIRRRARTREELIFGAAAVGAAAGYFLLSQTFALIYVPPATTFVALIVGAAGARLNLIDTAAAARRRGSRERAAPMLGLSRGSG